MCLLRPSGHCIACGGDAQPRIRGRIFPKHSFGPSRSFVITAGKEMSGCSCGLHSSDTATEWAQAHSPLEVVDRHVKLAEPNLRPPQEKPCRRKIRVELERPLDASNSGVKFMDDKGKHIAASCEGHRVVFTYLYSPRSEPCSV